MSTEPTGTTDLTGTLDASTPDAGREPAAEAPAETDPDARHRPRVRVGALVWALITAAASAWMLATAAVPARRDETLEMILGLTPLTATIALVLLFGTIALLLGITALLRRAQRRN